MTFTPRLAAESAENAESLTVVLSASQRSQRLALTGGEA